MRLTPICVKCGREMIAKRDYKYCSLVHTIVTEYLWKIKACDRLEEIWKNGK